MRIVRSPGMALVSHLPREVRLADTERCMDAIRIELDRRMEVGDTFKRIAEGAGMTAHTVSRIYYRETRYPRNNTIFALLRYFGYTVYARKEGNR